jgi:hypothetical protein
MPCVQLRVAVPNADEHYTLRVASLLQGEIRKSKEETEDRINESRARQSK